MTTRWGCLLATFMLAAGMTIGGCSAGDPSPKAPTTDGPLSASIGSGGISIAAPAKTRWFGTFGSPLLCTTTGDPLTVDRVEYDYGVEPVRPARAMIRTVDGERAAPILAKVGRWNHFKKDRPTEPGTLSKVEGFVVRRACKRTPRSYDELLTTAQAGPRGAWISRTLVYYSDRSEHYVLTIAWNYIMCGSAIEPIDGTNFCPPGNHN